MFSNLDFKATFGLAIKVTLDSNMVGNLSLKVKKPFDYKTGRQNNF